MPDDHRRRVLRRLRGRRHRPLRQPARRPVPAGGARLGRGVGRRPAAPVAEHAGRPVCAATTIKAGQRPRRRRTSASSRPTSAAASAPRSPCYPEETLLGVDRQAGRPPAAVAGDAHRVDDGARPRPGPGPVRHDRRQPRRQGHALPAARRSRTAAASPRWARSSPRS